MELINQEAYFWCDACIVARPNEEISLYPKYCIRRYDYLKGENDIRGGLQNAPQRPQNPISQGVSGSRMKNIGLQQA